MRKAIKAVCIEEYLANLLLSSNICQKKSLSFTRKRKREDLSGCLYEILCK